MAIVRVRGERTGAHAPPVSNPAVPPTKCDPSRADLPGLTRHYQRMIGMGTPPAEALAAIKHRFGVDEVTLNGNVVVGVTVYPSPPPAAEPAPVTTPLKGDCPACQK